MALENLEFKDQIGLIWRRTNRMGRRRRRREEEEEKRKKRRGRRRAKPKVWKLTLIMNPIRFGMDLWLGRIIIVPKHGVLLGFHLNPKMIASKAGKTPYDTSSS